MKKRMFITTIVMMLVLAVALTTSSLAWFSSANTSVTANAATFTAQANTGNTVNLKISQFADKNWGNNISLNNATGEVMKPLIPTTALIPTKTANSYSNLTFRPGYSAGEEIEVTHTNYVWPAVIDFNEAKVTQYDTENTNFVIDANNFVDVYTLKPTNNAAHYYSMSDHAAVGCYYEEFYIKNADTLQTIVDLKFEVSGSMTTTGTQDNDYTSNGYAAIIIYDEVAVAKDAPYPVYSYEYQTNSVKTATKDTYCWIPFAGFTFAMDQTANNENKNGVAWQYAELSDTNGSGDFIYNGVNYQTLNVQPYDALSGTDADDQNSNIGFHLNTDSLQALNSKYFEDDSTSADYKKILVDEDNGDDASEFEMAPSKVYKVAFYFWLDGRTLDSDSDTTVAQDISVKVYATGKTND